MSIRTNDETRFPAAENALKLVFDPEIGINIIDLGLVYDIFFNEENKTIVVRMTLTTEFCPMGESIMQNTEQALKDAFPEFSVSVVLTFDPPWNHEKISEAGKEFLTM